MFVLPCFTKIYWYISSNRLTTKKNTTSLSDMLFKVKKIDNTHANDDIGTCLYVTRGIPSGIVVDCVGQLTTVTCHLVVTSTTTKFITLEITKTADIETVACYAVTLIQCY